jgi:hypothetical protein
MNATPKKDRRKVLFRAKIVSDSEELGEIGRRRRQGMQDGL